MSCDLYAAIEQLYNNGMYSCVTELYPFIAASQTLSAAESANCALFQVTNNEIRYILESETISRTFFYRRVSEPRNPDPGRKSLVKHAVSGSAIYSRGSASM
jgi:hypothetical protein